MIDAGAAVDKASNFGRTALMMAAENANTDTVRALVEAGCDITIRGDKNKTAAEWAKEQGYPAIAEYLTNEAPRVQVHSTHRARAAP